MSNTYLRRYTDIPSLIGMLTSGELTLLEPSSWDDKNDSYFLQQYQMKKGLRSVLALCFTRASETYHHWRIFAPGSAGVCVWFDEERLLFSAKKVAGVRVRDMEYLTVDRVRAKKVSATRLPFIKRFPFKPESEVRMLWESGTEERSSIGVPFESDAVARVTLSPWLHPSLTDPMRALIRQLPDCKKYQIYRSTLVSNAEWKRHGRDAK